MVSKRKASFIAAGIVLGVVILALTGNLIAQSCFNTTPKGPTIIYEDSLTTGWSNAGSWSVTNTAQTAPGGQYGNYALRTDFGTTWSGVEFHLAGALVDTTTHGYVSFRIRKEDANGNNNGGILITGHRQDGTTGNWISLQSYLVYGQSTSFTPQQWYSVRVPFADMGITSGTLVQGIIFEVAAPTTAYFDEMVLIDGLSLGFPLQYQGWTPYTATIASVFDHSMTKTYAQDTDPVITAWTGEIGNGSYASTDNTCRQKSSSDQYGSSFFVNGHFNSGCTGVGGGTTYLSYQGHAGIDYPVPDDTPVYAAAAGTVIAGGIVNGTLVTDCPADGSSCVGVGDGYGRMRIQHPNGYTTWYMHLSSQVGGLNIGSQVTKGQLIGYTGHTSPPGSPVGPHLHFGVVAGSGIYDTPIDPYGWDGWYQDPYTSNTGDKHQGVFSSRQWW